MEDFKKYFDAEISHYIDYSTFTKSHTLDDDEVLWNIKNFITHQVTDIFLIHIDEDKLFLTKKELKKLPRGVRHYLNFSEHRGIKMYVFTTKDWWFKTAIGVFGWTTGRANEYYFDQIIADEQYKDITNKVSIKLTELLKK